MDAATFRKALCDRFTSITKDGTGTGFSCTFASLPNTKLFFDLESIYFTNRDLWVKDSDELTWEDFRRLMYLSYHNIENDAFTRWVTEPWLR